VTDHTGMVYVYGVVAAEGSGPPKAEGIEAAPVRLVGRPDLGALVSDLDADALSAPKAVRAHWRVLEEASANATVVPARFGMVLADDDAVRTELLEVNEPALAALLQELAGKVQLTVKGEYDEDAMLREVVRTTPAVAALNARISSVPADAAYYDRIRLGELVAEEVERRRLADTDQALRLLTPVAVEVSEQEVRTATAAFDLAFLVPRDGVEAFTKAVRALDEAIAFETTDRMGDAGDVDLQSI